MSEKQEIKIEVILPKFTPEQLEPLIDWFAEHLAKEFIREEYEKRQKQGTA